MNDFVRVRDVPESRALGVAGRTGEVWGESVPSASGVPVSGPVPDDFVVYVAFDEAGRTSRDVREGIWIAPEFLELDPVHYTPEELAARAEAGRRAQARRAEAEAHARDLDRPAERSPSNFLGRLLDRLWPG